MPPEYISGRPRAVAITKTAARIVERLFVGEGL